jgi:hypothetical protein
MATQSRNEKVVRIDGMSVAGGSLTLGKGMKYFTNLELDYSEVSFEEAIELASGGSSVRVQAQAKLRADEGTLKKHGIVAESLEEAISDGLADMAPIRFDVSTDFEAEKGGKRDPAKTAQSAFSKMDREQRIAFVMSAMGVEREQAELLVPKNEE